MSSLLRDRIGDRVAGFLRSIRSVVSRLLGALGGGVTSLGSTLRRGITGLLSTLRGRIAGFLRSSSRILLRGGRPLFCRVGGLRGRLGGLALGFLRGIDSRVGGFPGVF